MYPSRRALRGSSEGDLTSPPQSPVDTKQYTLRDPKRPISPPESTFVGADAHNSGLVTEYPANHLFVEVPYLRHFFYGIVAFQSSLSTFSSLLFIGFGLMGWGSPPPFESPFLL